MGETYDKKLVLNEWGRWYIPEIFRRVIAGMSLADIAQWLTDEKVPTNPANDNPDAVWWPRVVHKIVRSPTHTGFYNMEYLDLDTGNRVKAVHRCEALIDDGTFRQANEALKNRENRGQASQVGDAMLKGAITCPHCIDSPMYRINGGRRRKSGVKKDLFYYRCHGRGAGRVSCGNMIRVDLADAAVNQIMLSTFDLPVREKRVVPGRDRSAELDAVRHEIRMLAQLGLPWEQEDAERARLRAEYNRIDALPVVPATVVEKETGERYAALWAALPPSERGPWLAEHGFGVTADKTLVTVSKGEMSYSWDLSVPVALTA